MNTCEFFPSVSRSLILSSKTGNVCFHLNSHSFISKHCVKPSTSLQALNKRVAKFSNSIYCHSHFQAQSSLFTKRNVFLCKKNFRFLVKEHSTNMRMSNNLSSSTIPSSFYFQSHASPHSKSRKKFKTFAGRDDIIMENIAKVKPFFEQYIPFRSESDKSDDEKDSDVEDVEDEENEEEKQEGIPEFSDYSSSETEAETEDEFEDEDSSNISNSKDVSSTNSAQKKNFIQNFIPQSDSTDFTDSKDNPLPEIEERIAQNYKNDPKTQANSNPSHASGLSGVYLKTKSLLSSLTNGVKTLDEGIVRREKELDFSSKQIDEMITSLSKNNPSGNTSRDAVQRFRKLVFEFQELQREAAIKDKKIAELKKEGEFTRQKLKVAEEAAGEAEFLKKEIEIRHEEKLNLQDELSKAEEKGGSLKKEIENLKYEITERDVFIQKLQEEAFLSSSALQQAAKAMVAARDRTLRMEEQLEKTGDLLTKERINSGKIKEKFIDSSADLAEAKEAMKNIMAKMQLMEQETKEKELLLQKSKFESEKSSKMLELTSTSLEQAQAEIEALRFQLEQEINEENEGNENESIFIPSSSSSPSPSQLETIEHQKQMIEQSDARVDELYVEISSLKAMLNANDITINELKQENVKSSNLLIEAENTKKDLFRAESTIQQLEVQIQSLEKELSQQNTLLFEIKNQNEKTTEILKTAANYKKELNEAREKEMELMEKLQEKEMMIEDLKQELSFSNNNNNEMILRQLESRTEESEREVINLRKSIAVRDSAINLMKQQLQKTANVIATSAQTKETLRQMQIQIDLLNMEIEEKNEKLELLEEEITIQKNQQNKFSYQKNENNFQRRQNQYDDYYSDQGRSNTF